MKHYVYILAICVGAFVLPTPALSEVLNPNVVDYKAGEDVPQDGVFDSFLFVPSNLWGIVNNNGYADARTAFEFSLAGLPTGSTVSSAELTVALSNSEGARTLEVHGYVGDGAVGLADFARNGLVGTVSVRPQSYTPVSLDVTNFVANLVRNGETFAGFDVREEPANTVNYVVMYVAALPTLSITYSVPQKVDIDIKPGSNPNSLNLWSDGTVPVAILGGLNGFEATSVDPTSVKLAGAGVALHRDGTPIESVQDVNGDGVMDLVVHVDTDDLQLTANDTMAVLRGTTFGGTHLWGTDSVRVVQSQARPSCTPPPADMVSWWRGNNRTDSVGPNDGVLLGGTAIDPGLVKKAFAFDGSDDLVAATDIGLPLGADPRTLELWVQPGFNARVPFIYGTPNASDAYYILVNGPNVCIGQWGGEPTEPCGGTDVTDGAWHHLALTYDGAIARLYVDGTLEVEQEKLYATTSTGSAYIGSTATGSEEYFPGLIDEVTIYARALAPSEIRSIFASGSTGKCVPRP